MPPGSPDPSDMTISKHFSIFREVFENKECESKASGNATGPLQPRFINAIGDLTTAEIFRLYEKYMMRAEIQHRNYRMPLCNAPNPNPLLTVFITDLHPPQQYRDLLRWIRLYFSASYPLLIFFGEPMHTKRAVNVLFTEFFRIYPLNPVGIKQMHEDISLINQTVFQAQNMSGLILRNWSLASALNIYLKKQARRVLSALRSGYASLTAYALVQTRNAIFVFCR